MRAVVIQSTVTGNLDGVTEWTKNNLRMDFYLKHCGPEIVPVSNCGLFASLSFSL